MMEHGDKSTHGVMLARINLRTRHLQTVSKHAVGILQICRAHSDINGLLRISALTAERSLRAQRRLVELPSPNPARSVRRTLAHDLCTRTSVGSRSALHQTPQAESHGHAQRAHKGRTSKLELKRGRACIATN